MKIFKNVQDLHGAISSELRDALKETIHEMADKLREFIQEDVYNAYDPEFYTRTKWLLEPDTIEDYVWNDFGKGYGAGIKINKNSYVLYDNNLEEFQHGNPYTDELNMDAFIGVLNGTVNGGVGNPFHFPIIARRPFLDEFEKWAEENYTKILMNKLRTKFGIKAVLKGDWVANVLND